MGYQIMDREHLSERGAGEEEKIEKQTEIEIRAVYIHREEKKRHWASSVRA